MATANKITAAVLSTLDDVGVRLIRAVGMTGETAGAALEKRQGASKMAADHLYSIGWRTATVKAKVEANGERRSQVRAAIYSGFSPLKQGLVAVDGAALEALKKKSIGKKTLFEIRREAMQASGAYFALIEKALAALEASEAEKKMTDAEKEAAEKEAKAKAEKDPFKQINEKIDWIIKKLEAVESAPDGIDITLAVKRAKALKGGLFIV